MNGTINYLTDGTETSSKATAMTIQNGQIYVAGSVETSWGDYSRAAYWDGTGWELAQLSARSYATCITVQGKDIYVGGYYHSFIENKYSACYWKNGASYDKKTSADSFIYGIAVSEKDIYAVGYRVIDKVSLKTTAVCWKNGQAIDLPSSLTNSMAKSIVIKGTDIYIGGSGGLNAGSYETGLLWKNQIVSETNRSNVNCLAIDGTDIYLAGNYMPNDSGVVPSYYAAYFKNGLVTQLSQIMPSSVTGIAIVK